MTTYITTTDVDGVLGAGWEGTGDADQAVLEANAWMTARSVIKNDPVDDDVITAGAFLAQMSINGTLYADRAGAIKSKRVKADAVESETEYQDGASASTGRLRLVLDLLRPYLPVGGGSVFPVARA